MMEKLHMLHVTAYCSAISPCGKYLAVGNNYGYISIFNVSNALLPDASENDKKPTCIFKAHPGPVHALKTISKLLVSAGYGPIVGWRWADIINDKLSKCLTLSKGMETSYGAQCEMYNCLSYNSKNNILYSGGDDALILSWDLKTGKYNESFTGHTEYIHDLDIASNQLVSASEDGCVKVWDTRSTQCTQRFEPYKNNLLSRPGFGKWLSCVAIDSNGQWIVTGGGPKTSLWHLRSSNLITALPESKEAVANGCAKFSPNTITFRDDEIIAGGNQPNIYRWYVNGESKAVIPCSIRNVFSISFKPLLTNNEQDLPMVVTGNIHRIDLFTNLGYLGTSLSMM